MTNLEVLLSTPRSLEQKELAHKMIQEIIESHRNCDCREPQTLDVNKVIFNQDATIVYFNDCTKTVVKRQEGDVWNREAGMMAAFSKKLFGNDNTFNKIINKYCSPYYHEDERIQKALEKLAKNMRKFIATQDNRYAYADKKERQKEYEHICRDLEACDVNDKERYEELLALKNSIKADMSLFNSVYMTGRYKLKYICYGEYEYVLPSYAKEFIKLAKQYFDIELTVVDLKDDNFKIILREEDEDEIQE